MAERKVKKARMSVTLKTKLDVLHRFDIGERAVNIGIALGLLPTTVRTLTYIISFNVKKFFFRYD